MFREGVRGRERDRDKNPALSRIQSYVRVQHCDSHIANLSPVLWKDRPGSEHPESAHSLGAGVL